MGRGRHRERCQALQPPLYTYKTHAGPQEQPHAQRMFPPCPKGCFPHAEMHGCAHTAPGQSRAGGSRVAAFLECVDASCSQEHSFGSWSSAGGLWAVLSPSQELLAPPTPALSHLISQAPPALSAAIQYLWKYACAALEIPAL